MRKAAPVVSVFLAVGAYVVFVLAVRTGNNPSSKLWMLALEYGILLPAACVALLWERRQTAADSRRWFGLRMLVPVYLVATLPLAFVLRKGIYNADESAYLFESKAMLTGAVAAKAPPVTAADAAAYQDDFFFENHVIYHQRWFGKYPPGWPAVLAAGLRVHAGWLLNPLFGLVILWLAYRLACVLFDERTGRITALLLAASPFFVLNAVGYMSHPACGAAIAGATLLLWKGLESRRLGPLTWMFLLLACAFLIRPATTAAAAAVFVPVLIWRLRSDRRLLGTALGIGVVFGSVALGGLLLHNRALTGDFLLSPYAVSRNTSLPVEIDLHVSNLLRNLRSITSVSVAKTALDAIPFAYLLAICGLLLERRAWSWILAALWLMLIAAYLPQVEVSDAVVGERYYFEAYFALAILAARGWTLLADRVRVPSWTASALATGLIAVQVFHYGLLADTILHLKTGYGRVLDKVAEMRLADAVVLMKPAPGFGAKNFNPNAADWQRAPVFYVKDPGPRRRQEIVCALGRPLWVLITYRPKTGEAEVLEQGRSECGLKR